MQRRLRICRILACIMFAASLLHPAASSAGEECIDKDYARGMTIGGVLGTGAGIAVAAATGLEQLRLRRARGSREQRLGPQ